MIIGMTGKAGSGKDTIADILVRDHGFVKVALADPLKRICRDVFAFTDDQLWGPSSARNAPDQRYRRFSSEQAKACVCDQTFRDAEDFRDHLPCDVRGTEFLTPRHALQQLGTEWGRACYENVWVDLALRMSDKLIGQDPNGLGYRYTAQQGLVPTMKVQYAGVVIADVRFPNEVAAIHAKGGIIWKAQHGRGLDGAAGQHASEAHIDSLQVDALVERTTLDRLPYSIRGMLLDAQRKKGERT